MPPGAQISAALTPLQASSSPQGSQAVVAASPNLLPIKDMQAEAKAFLEQCYGEQHLQEVLNHRHPDVEEQLQRDGRYSHTYDELAYGARLAWRNSTRCLGRHLWQELDVRDRRDLESEEEMFAAIKEHIEAATNGGQLRSTITVFKPDGRRIWNPQFFRYAGYRQPDGSVLGDPMQLGLTDALLAMGWDPETRTCFDLLPIVIQLPGRQPRWFPLPPELILEVPIRHPHHDWFADLDLRWYALPAVSNMASLFASGDTCAAPAANRTMFNGDVSKWNVVSVSSMAGVLRRIRLRPAHRRMEHGVGQQHGEPVRRRVCVRPEHRKLEHRVRRKHAGHVPGRVKVQSKPRRLERCVCLGHGQHVQQRRCLEPEHRGLDCRARLHRLLRPRPWTY
jgi:hypothetical protein